jgi:pyruvate/2-oxoglutarate dehydrogenase complex dihydrolipoamide dehydrogenase (E3) component
MAQVEQYDALVLGSGQGGQLIAWHLAQAGRRTALVERRWIGGSCPNIACMPSKTEIWSARLAHLARHGEMLGIVTGPVVTQMETVLRRKRDVVSREVQAHLQAFEASGAELIVGEGRFIGPKTIEVRLKDGGLRLLKAHQVFLNIGTHAAVPEIPGLEAAQPLTHIEVLELDHAPRDLIVLGAGYVGIELAQAFRRFGSRVTVIEPGPRIMSREDADVSDEMQRILGVEGIQLLTSTELLRVRGRSGEQVNVELRTPAGVQEIEGSDLLIAAGRIPNTGGIGLDEAGVELDARGYIRVNDRLETTASNVWAIGECTGGPHFTHVSVDDFRIIRDNLAGGNRSTRDRLVPSCLFTDPPLAHVGLSEREAERQGIAVRIARLPMSGVLRPHTTGEEQGFMKALIGRDDRILGFTMIGSEAGEVMTTVQAAMVAELPYQRLRDTVIAHLTMAEGLGPLLSSVPPRTEEA